MKPYFFMLTNASMGLLAAVQVEDMLIGLG